jgi:hypothetical protein
MQGIVIILQGVDCNGDGLADVLMALGSRNAIAIAWSTDPGA